MRATISELWQSGREIISFDNSEFDRPASISELKKCENVLVGDRLFKGGPFEVLIDNSIVLVSPRKINHPSGFGSFCALEIY
jgi:hypothetical protein